MTCAEKQAILDQLYAEKADLEAEKADLEAELADTNQQIATKVQAIQVVQMQGCT